MSFNFKKTLLRRCNELALRSRGRTGTNPNVGAMVFNSDYKILGEGWHRSFGGPHAEVYAIQKASKMNSIEGQSIAVSLEPCNHEGKTPACTAAILDLQLSEVVIDQIDPDDRMSGRSVKMLCDAGISVPKPLNTKPGKIVIQPFRINIRLNRPYLRLKMAISQDHFIGQPGKQVKISGTITDRWVHRLRSETQAIMAGTRTLINDNPSLTCRYGNRNQPIRILPDREGILPHDLRVFTEEGDNIVLTTSDRSDYQAEIARVNPHDLEATLYKLYQKHIGSILIEGGAQLFTSLFESNLWDELILIQNPDLQLESGIRAPSFPSIAPEREIKLGTDTIKFINNPDCR